VNNELPRTIWLLWLQGWEHAPLITQQVRDSWKYHNEKDGWTITCIDQHSLYDYIDLTEKESALPPAAKSDVIRLKLLAQHGGIWADATLLCMRPVMDWLPEALPENGSGIWMYHCRDHGRGPASWFIVAKAQSYMITRWTEAASAYWKTHDTVKEYFWMDRLFAELALTDPRFVADWSTVPYLHCEHPYQAHCLAGRVFKRSDRHFRMNFPDTTAPVLKLSHHGSDTKYKPGTYASEAIRIAMDPSRRPAAIQWEAQPSFEGADFFTIHKTMIQSIKEFIVLGVRILFIRIRRIIIR